MVERIAVKLMGIKAVEKFMVGRCSPEVQILLTRIKERPEDFGYGTKWRGLVEVSERTLDNPYTRVERVVVTAHWGRHEATWARRALLTQIMKQAIDPNNGGYGAVESGEYIL